MLKIRLAFRKLENIALNNSVFSVRVKIIQSVMVMMSHMEAHEEGSVDISAKQPA